MNSIVCDSRAHVGPPDFLRQLPNWLCWKFEPNPGGGKSRKTPFYVSGGRRRGEQGSADDRAQLVTFDAARTAAARQGMDGVGIALLPGDGVVALDFDRCLQAGELHPKVHALLGTTYAEVSPSGTGVRAFFAGDLGNEKDAGNPVFGLELFSTKGYCTFTGAVLPIVEMLGNENTVAPVDDAVRALVQERFGHREAANSAAIDDAPLGLTRQQLDACLAALPGDLEYDRWLEVGMALHAELGAAGFEVWLNWSRRSPKFTTEAYCAERWRSFGRNRSGRRVTARSLVHLANQHGAAVALYDVATAEEFEILRRDHQKAENKALGEGAAHVPPAEVLSLEAALTRFVHLADGNRVADILAPHYDLEFSEWSARYAASSAMVPQGPTPGGKPRPDKEVSIAKLWQGSEHRKSVIGRTFKAGGSMTLNDPEGRVALNTWRGFDRSIGPGAAGRALLPLFIDHVQMLFGVDADRFLDWLAHIEQQPGVLPHTAWLHISRQVGMGRNWLASVLTRVWGGAVAANVNLPELLASSFNGMLSRKVLAYVDEIREGARDAQWAHAETMKSLITAEVRHINPKFGRQRVEFNACRWLMFSNHESAIPIDQGDRRIEVVLLDTAPRPPAYYTELYAALARPEFIAAVAEYLAERDIAAFNPGGVARLTEGKKAVVRASLTPTAEWGSRAKELWPSDLIRSSHLHQIIGGAQADGSLTAGHWRALEGLGVRAIARPVKVNGVPTRVTALRNHDRWNAADAAEIRAEVVRGEGEHVDWQDWRAYLETLAADAA